MPAVPATLAPEQIRAFEADGYVVLRGAFAREDALAMQEEWWAELAELYGIARDDPSTWMQPARDLRAAKASPSQSRMETPLMLGAIDDLLGAGNWRRPRDWGRAITTFPNGHLKDWTVPTELWHSDHPRNWHAERLNGLLVVTFFGVVEPMGGGTLILSGSPRLLQRQFESLPAGAGAEDGIRQRERFHRSHPWLRRLTGHDPSPPDRVAAFMTTATEVDGVPLRVVELTGEPGDAVLCHPLMMHAVSRNCRTTPRFMRIKQQLMTHELQAHIGQLARAASRR